MRLRQSVWAVMAAIVGCWIPWMGHGTAVAEEIGYIEDFALATDRTVPLAQLIPGTEEFYYYHCLHYQNTRQLDRVEPLLQAWIHRHQVTPRVREIQNRQALLTFSSQPDQTLEYLQRVLNIRFSHQRETLGPRPDLPSQLDPGLLERDRLAEEALRSHENLDGFEDAALGWLLRTELPPERVRHLLQRLTRPDYPELVPLVVADLNRVDSGGFGSLPLHRLLLLDQLDVCLQLKPDLINQAEFIQTYLSKIQPNDDIDFRRDVAAERAHVERLWSFAERLAPVHNSLKAHLFYHRLRFDLRQGQYDLTRFMTYIAIPRVAYYVNPRYVESEAMRRVAADLQVDYAGVTRLPPVMDDEPLIRAFLQHFFLTDATYESYQPYLDDTYLKHLFAETKIVHGVGDAEQWSALLPPEAFQALKQRVDLDFAVTNRRQFDVADLVELELHVKNVSTLIVKVFEVNTYNFYRQNLREVGTDVNLDGLVPNQELVFHYEEPDLRRVTRRFEFPEMNRAGVYVIDLIGNGKSSRAVIRKGRLRHVVRTTTAGHAFTIWNEQHTQLLDASIWMAGREYRADELGEIRVPFSTQPGRQPIVLRHGEFSQLDTLDHQEETYELAAGIFVDRESLLARQKAAVLIRPALYLNQTPVTLSELENARLTIASIDHDGVTTTKEVQDLVLREDRETVCEFQVPARLSVLQFTLKGTVFNVSQNRKVDLATSETFRLNGIDQTDKIEDVHLTRMGERYVLEVLGRTGEPRAHRPIRLTIKHRDFRQPLNVVLQSDEAGRVELGTLTRVEQVTAIGPQELPRTWSLRGDRHALASTLHAREGTALELPFSGSGSEPSREDLSLLELRGDQFVADRFDALRLTEGGLKIAPLPRGDYDLLVKATGERIRIRIAAGAKAAEHVLGEKRQLELRGQHSLRMQRIAVTPEHLEILLAHAGPFTRVHLFGVRYEPAYPAYDYLARIRDREPQWALGGGIESSYAEGRILGDEYRYIIDRRYAQQFPGIMLQRPSLLLNPWAASPTKTVQQPAEAGEDFAAEPAMAEPESLARRERRADDVEQAYGASLDFLAHGSLVLANLVPDEQGQIAVDRALLARHQRVWIVAVDPLSTTSRTVPLPESPREVLDLRLASGLDPETHYVQQKRISNVEAGATLSLENSVSARFEVYDSLAKVHSLLVTLSRNPALVEFSFVCDWDRLSPEERRAKYSQHACHELNFFLSRKDPEFFQSVVLPYLRNKLHKTFLDDYLLEHDLSAYLEPWRFSRLNVVEKILLGQRIADQSPRVRLLVEQSYELLPPNPERQNLLFETAVKGSSLEAGELLSEALAAAGSQEWAGRFNRRLALGLEDRDAFDDRRVVVPDEAVPGLVATNGVAGDKLAEKARVVELGRAYFSQDRKAAKELGLLFLELERTREWAENNYYQLPLAQQVAELVPVNAFWRDYARHTPPAPFRSVHFAEAATNFTDMMFALSVLDLPLRSSEHDVRFEPTGLSVTARAPMIVFHEDVRATQPIDDDAPVLVSQNFFRHDDRYRYVREQRLDKFVTDEFLVQTVYGCQVVVTNPTSTPQKLSLLLQVPVGAVPVLKGQWTRAVNADLQPFATTTVEYLFYFPFAGEFTHYPVQVAKEERVVAAPAAVALRAVEELSDVDRQSWQYVSQFGSDEELLRYLAEENLYRVDLEMIAFRMHDPVFFRSATDVLAARHIYHRTLWSYSVKHNVPDLIRVFLEHEDAFVQECGARIESPLLTIDPVVRGTIEQLDYRPLVNARAHRLGARRQIVNDRLFRQYQQLLRTLSYTEQFSDEQLMAVTYYLLLQDRFEEALTFFGRVEPERLATRLQYDYFAAYLDFLNDDPRLAGEIAARYDDYPVDRWRNAFAEIAQQLAEIHGEAHRVVDARDRDQLQAASAARQASFELQVESKKIRIHYQNVSQLQINYYLMDIELLFSRNPFVQQHSGQFSTIRPNRSAALELPVEQASIEVEFPRELENRNVLVEITGEGQTRSQAYYANSLSVQVLEQSGQVRVAHQDTLQPLAKVYVKAYARRTDGTVHFYKDGYTDLRGRFDYASLSTNELDQVERFALLIHSDQQGAVVREAAPPGR